MNKDQIKGAATKVGGKVQEAVGKITGNKTQEGKGLIKQAKGSMQKKVGDVKEVIKDNK